MFGRGGFACDDLVDGGIFHCLKLWWDEVDQAVEGDAGHDMYEQAVEN